MPTSRITVMSRTVYAWCVARTANPSDAEDLSQDVLLAMTQAMPNLQDEQAFYGFMWTVAHRVYCGWLRKKKREPLPLETLPQKEVHDPFAAMETAEDIHLLRRELSLLNERFRKAAVLYYVHGLTVAEIAEKMAVSPSMVKYLLFKARNIIREGMDMERNLGEQSYHPRKLDLRYWGHGPNHFFNMAKSLLRQNILFACYNDALTDQQIALAVGVGLPYMEEDLHQMEEVGLLERDAKGRYRTGIVLFTQDFVKECARLVAPESREIAEKTRQFIEENEEAVRSLSFIGADMNNAAFVWQMTALLLHEAVIHIAGERHAPPLPKDKWGVPCVCWSVEETDVPDLFAFSASRMGNVRNDFEQCMDFPINNDMVHHTLSRPECANVFLDVARNEGKELSENDAVIAADLVQKGYLLRTEKGLKVNCPVWPKDQYEKLHHLMQKTALSIADISTAILEKETHLLMQHVPEHLRKLAEKTVFFRLFDDAVSAPVSLLYAERFLADWKAASLLPTTYVVLQ